MDLLKKVMDSAIACFSFLTKEERAKGVSARYFTEANGNGDEIDTVKYMVKSGGKGLYFAVPRKLLDSKEAKQAFTKFAGDHWYTNKMLGRSGRISLAMVAIDNIIKAIASYCTWNRARAEQVVSLLQGKVNELAQKLEVHIDSIENPQSSESTGKAKVTGYDITE